MKYSKNISIAFLFFLYLSFTVHASLIQKFDKQKTIEILNQDYIDSYFNWSFLYSGNNRFNVSFIIQSNFCTEIKKCAIDSQQDICYENLKNNFLPTYSTIKIKNDLKNILSYPLLNDGNFQFNNLIINMNSCSGSFFFTFTKSGISVLGFGSTIIGVVNDVAYVSASDNLVKDSNDNLHLLYIDSGADSHYWNRTNITSTWIDGGDILTGYSIVLGSLVINSTNGLTAFMENIDSIYMSTKTNGAWSTPKNIYPDSAIVNFDFVSAVVDKNDVIHLCIASSGWNATAGNNLMIYTNISNNIFWTDGTVTNGTISYNGTFANVNASDDTLFCDIDVDSNNKPYIVTFGDDTIIYGINNSVWTKKKIDTGANLYCSIAIDQTNNNIFIAYENDPYGSNVIRIVNATNNTWLNTWDTKNITPIKRSNPSLKIDNASKLWLLYENSSTNGKEVILANSTANGLFWQNETKVDSPNSSEIWNTKIYPFLRGTSYPTFNRINDKLEWLFFNDTDNGLYYDFLFTSIPPANYYLYLSIQSPQNITYLYNESLDLKYTLHFENLTIDKCWYKLNSNPNVTLMGCLNSTLNTTYGSHTIIISVNSTTGITNQSSVLFILTEPTPFIWTSESYLLLVLVGILGFSTIYLGWKN